MRYALVVVVGVALGRRAVGVNFLASLFLLEQKRQEIIFDSVGLSLEGGVGLQVL